MDRHQRLLHAAESRLGELPARLCERLPGGAKVAPRLAAASRLHRTVDGLTDLRLELLRAKAHEERAAAAACAALERQIAAILRGLGSSVPSMCGLGATRGC